MPIKILMPALSPTMTEGNLVKWNKKEGDKVKAGEVIAEIETDKATMEVEAVDEGRIGRILIPAGTKNVKVNSLIAVLLEEGEDASALASIDLSDAHQAATSQSENKKEEKDAVSAPISAAQSSGDHRILASPVAKRIAAQGSVDINKINGSGPYGRVVKADVLSFIEGHGRGESSFSSGLVQRAFPEYSEMPISNTREVIAKRLCESKQQIPHFYLSVDCNISRLLEVREEINSATDSKTPSWKISVNDLVIKAVAMALKKVPEANSSWTDKAIIRHNNVDVSVAVSIPEGLITPIVKNADQKSVLAISREMKDLANRARQGLLKLEEFQGGSATISNLGMFGIKQFNAIINPPQSCIFAVGAAEERPCVIKKEIKIASIMNATLSCDHRIVDGVVGANLLQAFKEFIEYPSRLLI